MMKRSIGTLRRQFWRDRERAEALLGELRTATMAGAPDKVILKINAEIRRLSKAMADARVVEDVEPCVKCGADVVISMPPPAAFAVARCVNLHTFAAGNTVPVDQDFGPDGVDLVWCETCAPAVAEAELRQRLYPAEPAESDRVIGETNGTGTKAAVAPPLARPEVPVGG